MSGDFHKILYALIETKYQLVQTDLFGNNIISRIEWVLIGIYSAELLGVDPSIWSHRIDLDHFDVYWDENERFAELVRKKEKIVDKKLI